MIMLEVVLVALLLSLATGGSLRNLESERLRGERYLIAVLPLQLAWPTLSRGIGVACAVSLVVWLLMMASLIIILSLNVGRRWTFGIAALGIVLNLLVIASNGAMPVSMRSVSEIGASRAGAVISMGADCLHEELDSETLMAPFADVIAIPGPRWQRGVVSIGDLLLSIGLGGWVFAASRSSAS